MNFLQTKEWADFQRRLGRSVFLYNKDGIRCFVFTSDLLFGKKYLHIPYGPDINFNEMKSGVDNALRSFVSWLRSTARRNNAIFIKAEPLQDNIAEAIKRQKFIYSKKNIEPKKTVLIDLSRAHDEMLDATHRKTRYNIKVAQRHNIVVQEIKNIDVFWQLLHETSVRDDFTTHQKNYYETLFDSFKDNTEMPIRLWAAKSVDKIVSTAMILTHSLIGYYLHGASDYGSRAMMGPHILQWEIIKNLKAQGMRYYDMWGIDSHKWPGVTRFKLRWGGRVVEYPGAFDLTVSRPWHIAYRVSRRVLSK